MGPLSPARYHISSTLSLTPQFEDSIHGNSDALSNLPRTSEGNLIMETVAGTYGALLIGGILASGLSGIVTVQGIVFFKLYPDDKRKQKIFVAVVWFLDIAHTAFISAAIWRSLITNFGLTLMIDVIPKSVALSVIFTAVLTFLAQCYFARRIFLLSKRNYWLTIPILLLAILRLGAASASAGEMFKLKGYHIFRERFRWLFSVGLGLSCAVDIMITISLSFLLRRSRRQSLSMDEILDALIVYTFEIGSLTSAATVISLVCWLTLENNLIFLGIHFIIGKLYANSVLATLNTRLEIGKSRATALDLMDLEAVRHPPQGVLLNQGGQQTEESESQYRRNSEARTSVLRKSNASDFDDFISLND